MGINSGFKGLKHLIYVFWARGSAVF